MHKYKVGDRVICISDRVDGNILHGRVGTIAFIRGRIGVVFDEPVGGHDLSGECEYGLGWWVDEDDIALYEDEAEDDEFDSASESDLMRFLLGK